LTSVPVAVDLVAVDLVAVDAVAVDATVVDPPDVVAPLELSAFFVRFAVGVRAERPLVPPPLRIIEVTVAAPPPYR
jgi:hypothetical protein